MNNNLKILIGAVVVIGGLAAAWYLASPLFIDNSVDEAFPVSLPTVEEAADMSADEIEQAVNAAMDDVMTLTDAEMEQVEERLLNLAAQMPDTMMDEAMPADGPTILSQGEFTDADAFHLGSGTATIYTLEDGSRILRFEDFDVTNGPDLHVLLSTHPNPLTRDEVGTDYIDLGSLKGNMGNQNYEIP
ncbi:MAG: DM13 domain-containing protein, partial [Chloroflexota bacterium]